MRKMSLARAKAHISDLVDQAEHHGRRTLILRHGKPAAALVPVNVALPPRQPRRRLARKVIERSVNSFIEELSAAEPGVSAVEDLIASRR